MAEGKGFSFAFDGPPGQATPTSQQAPLVSYVLWVGYVLWGIESQPSFWFVLIVQAVVSSLGVLALAEAAFRASGRQRVGWSVGGLVALYPPYVASVCHVQAVTWNLSALAFLLLGWLLIREGVTRNGVICFAGASLVGWHADPIVGGVSLALLLALWIPPSTSWKVVVSTGLLIVVGILPWSIRNYVVHGQFVMVKDSFWYVFWQGNTIASHGTDKIPPAREEMRRVLSQSIESSVQQAQQIREGNLHRFDVARMGPSSIGYASA